MISAILSTLLFALSLVLNALFILVFLAFLMTWLFAFGVLNPNNSTIAQFNAVLQRLVEPMLKPLRKRLPKLGGVDISSFALLLIIVVLRYFVAQLRVMV